MSSFSSALSSFFAHPNFLSRVLWADAASGVGTALLQCEFADALAPLLGLPANLLVWSGAALGGFVLFIAWIASRRTIPAGPVWLLIATNAAWALGCAGLLASSAIAPTVMGEVFLIVQVVFVGVLVELEWIGVRKIQPEPAW